MKKKKLFMSFLQVVVVLFGISFLTFGLTYISPGDPAEIMLTDDGVVPPKELVEKTREELGLNKPFMEQYFVWLKGVVTGDMGTSYSSKMPVIDKLISNLGPTLQLSFAAVVLVIVIAIPLGILSAVYKNKFLDYIIRFLSFFGISMPSFWIGLLLLSVFAVKLRWFPVLGGEGRTDFKSMVLPCIALALPMIAKYTRQVRTAVLEEMNKKYVQGARMRGVSEKRILLTHIMPNALLPLVTVLGLSIGSILGGTAIVETIFSWPGLGSMAVSAIKKRDYPLIQGYVLWSAIIYLVINMGIDKLYKYMDPRIKE